MVNMFLVSFFKHSFQIPNCQTELVCFLFRNVYMNVYAENDAGLLCVMKHLYFFYYFKHVTQFAYDIT